MTRFGALVSRLFEQVRDGSRRFTPGVQGTLGLLHQLNGKQPIHRIYPTIHVAGTNGKGSVTTKLSESLRAMGYKVGLFTSPHLFSFRERIVINGEPISESAVERLLPPLLDATFPLPAVPWATRSCSHSSELPESETPTHGTFFEITTVLALQWFAEQQVDCAVFEVGLGLV